MSIKTNKKYVAIVYSVNLRYGKKKKNKEIKYNGIQKEKKKTKGKRHYDSPGDVKENRKIF